MASRGKTATAETAGKQRRRAWPEWDGFSRERLFYVRPGGRVPLVHQGFLAGDAGFGRSAPRFLPVETGVLVSRQGVISLHVHGLREEVWRREVPDWPGKIVIDGQSVLFGTDRNGEVMRVDVRDGRLLEHACYGRGAVVAGFTEETLLVWVPTSDSGELLGVDRRSWMVRWRFPALGQHTSFGERYAVQDSWGRVLKCVDALDGSTIWTVDFRVAGVGSGSRGPSEDVRRIVQGFPSVVAAGETIVVILMDGTVCRLDAASGKVCDAVNPKHGLPGGRPIHVVTETSIVYFNPYGLVEYDHGRSKVVARMSLEKQMASLCAGMPPQPCAFWLTEESVVWTSANGALMGVNRTGGKAWMDARQGALMPIADFPMGFGDFLYYSEKGQTWGLHCYRSAQSGKA